MQVLYVAMWRATTLHNEGLIRVAIILAIAHDPLGLDELVGYVKGYLYPKKISRYQVAMEISALRVEGFVTVDGDLISRIMMRKKKIKSTNK